MNVQLDLSQYDTLDHAIETVHFHEQVRRLWLHAERHLTKEQYDDIISFTFREAYLSDYERDSNDEVRGNSKHFTQNTHHNAARLSNDDVIAIPSWPCPQIPGNMAITVTRIMK